MTVSLFPFVEYWWFYLAFLAFVALMLLLDLGVFHRESHVVSFKESATWSAVWISLALIFNAILYFYALREFPNDARLMAIDGFDPAAAARSVGLEFLTGFVIEKALAVDNIFVFVVVFSYFSIPLKYQHRVLFFGILGALVFRAAFIALGAILMQYQWVVWVFGAFLMFTGIKMMTSHSAPLNPGDNIIVRFLRRKFRVSDQLDGDRLFTKKDGLWYATPLFIALVFVEFTDIIFAVDSVPAIFAVTDEPLIVFTSNIFAILGLRSLYFMLAGVVDRFHLLKYGLALVLIFVGLKMVWLNEVFDGHFPIVWSLGIIAGLIGGAISLSLLFPKKSA